MIETAEKSGAVIGGATLHEKKVDLGVLRDADHDGLGTQVPFEMVSGDREEQVFNMP